MTPKDISVLLANDAERVAAMLLPAGKRAGQEWCAGNITGDAGDSLKVRIAGSKAGVWSDFATGQSGDLLDLWCAVRNIGLAAALDDARDYLGVERPVFSKPQRAYSKPAKPQCHRPKDGVAAWLRDERGLSDQAIDAYKIAERGDSVVFPSLRDGELLRWKSRHKDDKHKCQTSQGSEPCLFGWQAIPDNAREVVICEGEIDAVSWWQMGYPALSVPSGAKALNWIDAEFDHLARFDVVYLAYDADQAGQEAVPRVAERLGMERVRVIDTSPYKDANDMLRKEPQKARWCVEQATSLDPKELKPAAHYEAKVVDIFTGQAKEVAGWDTPWQKLGGRFRFRPSEVTVLAGENFSGKSEVCGQIAVHLMSQGLRACVASLEMNPENWIVRIMQQVGCVPSGTATEAYAREVFSWLEEYLWVFGVVGTSKLDRILEVFAYARKRYGIWLFVIDNLQKCGLADDDYNGQKALVDQLTDFAKEHQCHVILVHHLNKSADEGPGTSTRVKGSGGITDMADNVVIWWRNRPKEREIESLAQGGHEVSEEVLGKPDAMLIVEKQRNSGDTPKLLLWFDKRSHQFLPSRKVGPIEYLKYQTRKSHEL